MKKRKEDSIILSQKLNMSIKKWRLKDKDSRKEKWRKLLGNGRNSVNRGSESSTVIIDPDDQTAVTTDTVIMKSMMTTETEEGIITKSLQDLTLLEASAAEHRQDIERSEITEIAKTSMIDTEK